MRFSFFIVDDNATTTKETLALSKILQIIFVLLVLPKIVKLQEIRLQKYNHNAYL
jgi:hypothetical protein